MKKNIICFALAFLGSLTPTIATETNVLVPEYGSVSAMYVIDDCPLYHPLSQVNYYFDEDSVEVAPDIIVILSDDSGAIYNGKLYAQNYPGYSCGYAVVDFGEKILLPKGGNYNINIPAGAIWLKNNPELKTAEINSHFYVPEHLYPKGTALERDRINPNSAISLDHMGFYFTSETEKGVDNPITQLYRKNLLVRSYPTSVSWDWNLGQTYCGFGRELKFEKGVEFAFVLPEGSACSAYRDDIVNKEERVDFIGGYEGLPVLTYSSYALYDAAVEGLGRITFTYDRPIMIDPEAKIQLFQDSDNPVMEVTPTIQEINGEWTLIADFTQAMIDKDRGYSVVIPAETVISADGDIIVNDRNELAINGGSGVEEIDSDSIKVSAADGTVRIEGAPTGTPIEIYSPSGRLVTKTTDTSVNLPAPGIYILKIANSATKIILP